MVYCLFILSYCEPNHLNEPIAELVILSIASAQAIVRENSRLFDNHSVIHVPLKGTLSAAELSL